MPQQTKTFRVFISSTFADMQYERNSLQMGAIQKLKKFCKWKGTRFKAVELLWRRIFRIRLLSEKTSILNQNKQNHHYENLPELRIRRVIKN